MLEHTSTIRNTLYYSDFKIFSGTSNLKLTEKIIKKLDIIKGNIFHHTFPSGEKYCQYKENIRGKDVFLVQSPSYKNTNDSFMELLIMADAAKRASASRITAVMPMSFYTRQDRKDKSRVPISSRLCLDLLEKSGIDRILTMDLHAEQIAGFTNLPFDHLLFNPILIDYLHKNKLANKDLFLMAPDAGALKRVEKYATILKCQFGFVSKRRIDDENVDLQSVVGDVKDKTVILIDDLTESFGTLMQSASVCKKNGAKKVFTAVTHSCLTPVGINRMKYCLSENLVDKFIFGDTIDNLYLNEFITDYADFVDVLTVSDIFASAIMNIHTNNSISNLFKS